MKMLYGCPFEKKEKEVFFRLTTFFFRNKKILFKEQLLFSFLCIGKQKKISERSKKFFFENLLSNFRKKKFLKIFIFQNLLNGFWKIKNFKISRITPKFFFAFQYLKNWTKVVPWTKIFCSWKKKFKSTNSSLFFRLAVAILWVVKNIIFQSVLEDFVKYFGWKGRRRWCFLP